MGDEKNQNWSSLNMKGAVICFPRTKGAALTTRPFLPQFLASFNGLGYPYRMADKESKTALAQDRTNWAQDRTIMANERTFSSWMGTGLGAIGVAIGLKAVFGAFEPTWAAKAVASIFLIAAIAIFWSARKQACKTLTRLRESDVEATPSRSFTLLASVMTFAAVATGAILWSL